MAKPTDPLYDDQWHFSLIGDIETIWEEYDGTGVTVVVYDEGVEYTHEDLAANYDASMHFTYDGITYDPMPIDGQSGHGTSCAGIIGAVDNNGLGGTGVAPGVTITGVNYLDDLQFQPQDVYDAGVLWAQNFDIMSNSWGWSGAFTRPQSLAVSDSVASHDMDLWAVLLEVGRNGLGTVIVQAAGNASDNANGDGWNVSRYSITIAAAEQTGEAADYTNFGSSILITAPASGVTTDLTGSAGYNKPGTSFFDSDTFDEDYTSQFNGTSAATPTVSGVVALMLDANAGLGWRDVQTILALSASHTGSAMGGPGTGFEVGSWQTVGGNTWNGGGTMFHQSYGYGMLNAYGAVRMAEAWATLSPVANVTSNEVSATGSYTGAQKNIPDNTGAMVSVSMNVAQDITVENIEITLTLTHANATHLNIWLEAPDGTRIQLMTEGDGSARVMDDGLTWVFGVTSLQGYSSAGTWKIVFEDGVTGETGKVTDASIEFFGAETSIDTLFHFTDDFVMLEALESSRSVIDDLDGGIDWLNFAAMTGNLTLVLSAGGAISLNGVVIAALAAGVDEIENAFMGDGADDVKGSSLANELMGMRGNDILRGGNGKDRVEGGDGKDTLHGDNGNDTLLGGAGNDLIFGTTGNDQMFGEAGKDTFVFAPGFGSDRVKDFTDNSDQLKLDDAIWGGGKTAAQVVSSFASVVGSDTVFDFGGGQKITVQGVTDTSIFVNDILIF